METETAKVSAARDLEFKGEFTEVTAVRMDFANGTALQAPAGASITPGLVSDIKDIIDIACKLTDWCGGGGKGGSGGGSGGSGGGGGGTGCYTIVTPDGTTITICPPRR